MTTEILLVSSPLASGVVFAPLPSSERSLIAGRACLSCAYVNENGERKKHFPVFVNTRCLEKKKEMK